MLAQNVAGKISVPQIMVRVMDDVDLPVALWLPVDRASVARLAVGEQHEVERRWLAQIRDVDATGVAARRKLAEIAADLLGAPGDEDRGGSGRAVVGHAHIDPLAQTIGDANEEEGWIDRGQAHLVSPGRRARRGAPRPGCRLQLTTAYRQVTRPSLSAGPEHVMGSE